MVCAKDTVEKKASVRMQNFFMNGVCLGCGGYLRIIVCFRSTTKTIKKQAFGVTCLSLCNLSSLAIASFTPLTRV